MDNCSAWFWVLFVLPFPVMFAASYLILILQQCLSKQRKHIKKQETEPPVTAVNHDELVAASPDPNNVSEQAVDVENMAATIQKHTSYIPSSIGLLLLIPMVLFFVGVVVALLGTGAGTFLSPLFVSMHIPPEVGSATSSFMMTFSALSISIQYLVAQRLAIDYAAWFLGIGMVTALVGQIVVRSLVRKCNSSWIMLWIMVVLLVLSFVLLVPQTVLLGISTNGNVAFSGACN